MPVLTRIRNITFDAADPYTLAAFWAELTGCQRDPDSRPDDEAVLVLPSAPDVPGLLFIRVPEAKSAKNRIHLDLQPQGRTRDEEVLRIQSLGATITDDRRNPDGTGWVVMLDPEGNELCIERSAPERAATKG